MRPAPAGLRTTLSPCEKGQKGQKTVTPSQKMLPLDLTGLARDGRGLAPPSQGTTAKGHSRGGGVLGVRHALRPPSSSRGLQPAGQQHLPGRMPMVFPSPQPAQSSETLPLSWCFLGEMPSCRGHTHHSPPHNTPRTGMFEAGRAWLLRFSCPNRVIWT